MASEREEDCGHRECHVHPGPQAKTTALEIAAQAQDNDVDGGRMNRHCGDGRRESHDEGNDYRDVTRRHLIPRDSHDGPFAPARPLRLGGAHGVSGEALFLSPVRSEIKQTVRKLLALTALRTRAVTDGAF